MTSTGFSSREILELVRDETGGSDPLASFWHARRAGLDGVTIIRRTGTGGGKRHEIDESDLLRLAKEAERAMRRYIAEQDLRRYRAPRARRVFVRRLADRRIVALSAVAALVKQLRARGVLSQDVQRTIQRTTPFTLLEVYRAVSA